MKIEKLQTLSQFVESLIPKVNESTERIIFKGLCFNAIIRCNNFLNQQVLKYMVWNKYKAIEEAEKKVIFENVKKDKYPSSYNLSNNYNIGFTESGIYLYNKQSNKETSIKTFLDLAIATKGELSMQNLDI